MPKIPQYTQNQLASSLVGTPGVDASAGDVATAVQSGLNTLETNIRSIAVVEYQENQRALRAKQAEDRALARQQQAMIDDMDAAKAQYDIDRQLDLKMAAIKEQNLDNPDAAVQAMAQIGPEFISEYRDNLNANDVVKTKAFTGSLNRFREQLGGMQNTWAGEQKVKAGLAKFESMADWTAINIAKNAEGTNSMLSVPQAVEWMQNFAKTSTAFSAIGVNEADIRKQTEKMAANYLSRLSYENPDQLTQVIKQGVFDDFIDGASRNKLYNDVESHALARARDQREEQQYTTAVTMADTTHSLQMGAIRGETTPADFQAAREQAAQLKANPSTYRAIDSIEAQQLNRNVSKAESEVNKMMTEEKRQKREQAKALEKSQRDADLTQVLTELKTAEKAIFLPKSKKGKRYSVVSDKYSAEQVSEYLSKLVIAETKEYLSPAEAAAKRSIAMSALQRLNKKDPEAATHARQVLLNVSNIRKWSTTRTNDVKENRRLGVEAINNFYSMFEQYTKAHNGTRPTGQQLQNLMNAAAHKAELNKK
jgi:hypothetical protein